MSCYCYSNWPEDERFNRLIFVTSKDNYHVRGMDVVRAIDEAGWECNHCLYEGKSLIGFHEDHESIFLPVFDIHFGS